MSQFNPFARAASWLAALAQKTTTEYDAKSDPRSDGTHTDAYGEPIVKGEYLTDGVDSVTLKFSVGNGKGSTAVEIPGRQLDEVANVLEGWEVVDLDKLSAAECIRRTIARNAEDKTIEFKVSLAKNSRTVVVPEAEWDGFVQFMSEGADSVEDAVAHYRSITAAEEAAEAEKARKAAEKAAANAGK